MEMFKKINKLFCLGILILLSTIMFINMPILVMAQYSARDLGEEQEKIRVNEEKTVTLTYDESGNSAIIYKIDCPKSGVYSLKNENFNHWTYDEVKICEANANGQIDIKNCIYSNEYAFEGKSWYTKEKGCFYLDANKIYYLYMNKAKKGYSESNTKTGQITLKYNTLEFDVESSGDRVGADASVSLALSCEDNNNRLCIGYAQGNVADLENAKDSKGNNIAATFKGNNTTKLYAIVSDPEAIYQWKAYAKYYDGYKGECKGNSYGTILADVEGLATKIAINYSKEKEELDKVIFRPITDYSEIKQGAHYIFTVYEEGKHYALAADENKYISPIKLESKQFTNYKGETNYLPSTIVDNKTIENSDYIFTCSKAAYASQESALAKFVSNTIDPTNGKRLSLKMGNSGGDLYSSMFSSISGGEIELRDSYYYSGSSIYHSGYSSLACAIDNTDGEPFFYWNYRQFSNISGNHSFTILTDAPVEKNEEVTGDKYFSRVKSYDLTHVTTEPIVFAYKAEDGKYYALTKDGTKEIEAPSKEMILKTSVDNSWLQEGSINWDYSDTKAAFYNNGYKRGDTYLNLNSNNLLSNEASRLEVLMARRAINSSGEWDYFYYYDNVKFFDGKDAYIGWDNESKNFKKVNSIEKSIDFEPYIYYPARNMESYHKVNDLSNIEDWSKLVITYKDKNNTRKLLVPRGDGQLELIDISDNEQNGTAICYSDKEDTINVMATYALTPGVLKSSKNMNFKLASLGWKYMNSYIYIDGYLNEYGYPLKNEAKECMFTYTQDEEGIIMRGAKKWLYYDEKNNLFTAVENKEDASKIELWALSDPNAGMVEITYHDVEENKNISHFYTKRDIDLIKMLDKEKNGKNYIFLGWTKDKEKAGYLTLENSCDLYDYNDDKKAGSIKTDVAQKLEILGHCNPEKTDSISPSDYAIDGKLDLYPIYALKAFDSAVTADDEEGSVVGISDWKDLQPSKKRSVETSAEDDKQRWLGKITCTVYKDGELWVDSEPMYFRYHNDDAADINVKFISDELLKKYSNESDPIYSYLSDRSMYPDKSQVGDYVIDAVFAYQGGSEDGLKYQYNWMKENGGQLDNVQGGSNIKIYVTSRYQVKYYLNDKELTGSIWKNKNFYTSPGTENEFEKNAKTSDYKVTKNNANHALEDGSIKDDSVFLDSKIARGEYETFAYYINSYPHAIPIPAFPKAPEGETLTSSVWALKDSAYKTLEEVDPSSKYAIVGKAYGSGNTVNSYLGEEDATNTYHLYIYSDKEENTVSKGKDDSPKEPKDKMAGNNIFTGNENASNQWLIIIIASSIIGVAIIVITAIKRKK